MSELELPPQPYAEPNPDDPTLQAEVAGQHARLGIRGMYNRLTNRQARRELVTLVGDLADRLDYDGIANHFANASADEVRTSEDIALNTYDQFAYLYSLQQRIADGSIKYAPTSNIQFWLSTLRGTSGDATAESIQQQWLRRGFLRDEAYRDRATFTAAQKLAATHLRHETIARGNEALADLDTYGTLAGTYQTRDDDNWRISDYGIRSLTRALERETLGATGGEYDPRLTQATALAIDKKIAGYMQQGMCSHKDKPAAREAMLERQRSLATWETISREIRINGIDNSPEADVRVLVDRESLLATMSQTTPACFLAGLDQISFLEPDIAKTEDGRPRDVRLGHYNAATHYGEKQLPANIEIYQRPTIKIDTSLSATEQSKAEATARHDILGTAEHEVGHHVLETKISLDEMLGWEDVMAHDPTAVTQYVHVSRIGNDRQGRCEDFCESFRMFAIQPAVLQLLSPARFDYMKGLFLSRLPDSERDTYTSQLELRIASHRNTWQQLGKSEDELRATFQYWLT